MGVGYMIQKLISKLKHRMLDIKLANEKGLLSCISLADRETWL